MSETPTNGEPWKPYNPNEDPDLQAIAGEDVTHLELMVRLNIARERFERIASGAQPGNLDEARGLKADAQDALLEYRYSIGFYPDPAEEEQP